MSEDTKDQVDQVDPSEVAAIKDTYDKVLAELHKKIIGQNEVVEQLLISIFSNGHCLMVGVPGLAKTLLVQSLAETMKLSFKRIQFTPDLMPSDITGTDIIQEDPDTRERRFEFLQGPIFANIILADEINRTPPKTQAALLESMQERQVTIGQTTRPLPPPFFVLATQNPIEQEGTYPLPEAQQDRFLFLVWVDYPEGEDEMNIIKTVTSESMGEIEPVLSGDEIISIQNLLVKIPVPDHVVRYSWKLVRALRPGKEEALPLANDWIQWGPGPRASINLVKAAKTRAVLNGNLHVSVDDIQAIAHPVLRHRVIPNFAAQAEGYSADKIVDMAFEQMPPNE
ncbi:MAG: MoxR family ATPase [Planctomycetota bacterium]|nr:MoxR family ATPase [Planctomycetota bacterium]